MLFRSYDFDTSFLDSLDFGVSWTENKIRSAFGVYEQAAWGGQGTPADLPDDIFSVVKTSDLFEGLKGVNGDVLPAFLSVDSDALTRIMIDRFGACDGGPDCLAPYNRVDSRVRERTAAPYVQINNTFDLFSNPAHLIAGLRYEKTKIASTALAQIPTSTSWVSANEFTFNYTGNSSFNTLKGDYDEWLPSIDFDMSDRKSTRLNSSHTDISRMPSSA